MDERRKRIRVRAWRRGLREVDLIVGRFADAYLEQLDEAGLVALEALLQQPDPDVYDWLLGRAAAPSELAGLIGRMQETSVLLTRPE
jgi:antitoxin CptB